MARASARGDPLCANKRTAKTRRESMLKHLSAYILLLGLVCQIGHAQRSGGTFSILSESIGPLGEGNTSTTGFSQIGASEAVQGTFATATTGFSGTGFLSHQNSSPTDLNFNEPLTIVENQTIGTVVGEFNATDVDGGTITYSLASGGVDNHLFSISSSGVLRSLNLWIMRMI